MWVRLDFEILVPGRYFEGTVGKNGIYCSIPHSAKLLHSKSFFLDIQFLFQFGQPLTSQLRNLILVANSKPHLPRQEKNED